MPARCAWFYHTARGQAASSAQHGIVRQPAASPPIAPLSRTHSQAEPSGDGNALWRYHEQHGALPSWVSEGERQPQVTAATAGRQVAAGGGVLAHLWGSTTGWTRRSVRFSARGSCTACCPLNPAAMGATELVAVAAAGMAAERSHLGSKSAAAPPPRKQSWPSRRASWPPCAQPAHPGAHWRRWRRWRNNSGARRDGDGVRREQGGSWGGTGFVGWSGVEQLACILLAAPRAPRTPQCPRPTPAPQLEPSSTPRRQMCQVRSAVHAACGAAIWVPVMACCTPHSACALLGRTAWAA